MSPFSFPLWNDNEYEDYVDVMPCNGKKETNGRDIYVWNNALIMMRG